MQTSNIIVTDKPVPFMCSMTILRLLGVQLSISEALNRLTAKIFLFNSDTAIASLAS